MTDVIPSVNINEVNVRKTFNTGYGSTEIAVAQTNLGPEIVFIFRGNGDFNNQFRRTVKPENLEWLIKQSIKKINILINSSQLTPLNLANGHIERQLTGIKAPTKRQLEQES